LSNEEKVIGPTSPKQQKELMIFTKKQPGSIAFSSGQNEVGKLVLVTWFQIMALYVGVLFQI
jgi:hypothetical protein